MTTPIGWLEPAPLMELADRRAREARIDDEKRASNAPGSIAEIADLLGVSRRTAARLRAGQQLSTWKADRFAVRLGVHPTGLWPEFNKTSTAGDTCTEEGAHP